MNAPARNTSNKPQQDDLLPLDGAQAAFAKDLNLVLAAVRDILLEKNRMYGDAALSPVRVFSKASPVEQLKVRIDDKLSRLMSGQLDDTEDVELDLLGYLIITRIAKLRDSKRHSAATTALNTVGTQTGRTSAASPDDYENRRG